MTQSHEGETVLYTDSKGNRVDSAEKASTIEIVNQDGTHTILAKPDKDGNIKDPF
jgi:hypothetical protein